MKQGLPVKEKEKELIQTGAAAHAVGADITC